MLLPDSQSDSASVLRKFKGIREKIGQYLAQADRISCYKVMLNLPDKFKMNLLFFCLHFHHFN